MTSSNGNIFHVTGHLCGQRWIPHTKAGDVELLFSLICAWINGWVNNCEAGDLRRHRAHYNATLMQLLICAWYHVNVKNAAKYIYYYHTYFVRDVKHNDDTVCLVIKVCQDMHETFLTGQIPLKNGWETIRYQIWVCIEPTYLLYQKAFAELRIIYSIYAKLWDYSSTS